MYNESMTAPRASTRGLRSELDAEFDQLLDSSFWKRDALSFWLRVRGEQQEQLFAAARAAREKVFGRRVVVRGLIEEGRLPLDRGKRRDKDAQMRWAIVLPIKNRDVYKSTFKEVSGESQQNRGRIYFSQKPRCHQLYSEARDERSRAKFSDAAGLI